MDIPRRTVTYWDNGNIATENYRLKGKRHREDGPAYRKWSENGSLLLLKYYINGKLHNENGPAILIYGISRIVSDPNLVKEMYYINDMLHRENGPAVVVYRRLSGISNIAHKIYFCNGKKHRIGGPADINYSSDGYVYLETYYENGLKHRADGPAMIQNYYGCCLKFEERWYEKGRLHNNKKPAVIGYNVTGEEVYRHFYIEGKRISVEDIVESGFKMCDCKNCGYQYIEGGYDASKAKKNKIKIRKKKHR